MSVVEIINRLSNTSSRIDKEQIILDAYMQGEREFFVGAQLAYDILVSFGVKKVAEIAEDDAAPGGTFGFDDFLKLADKLRRRELTGNAAKDAIFDAADNCDVATWNTFYRRVLLKDLKCGVKISTINKVLSKLAKSDREAETLLIPEFSCQLAHDGMKPEHQKKLTGSKMLDVKLDGVRLLTILDKDTNTVNQYTRNGQLNENFVEIREMLHGMIDEIPSSMVLDGEITSSSFQELMTQVNRRTGVDTSSTKLALFDMVPLRDFKAGICNIPQFMRQIILGGMSSALQKHCGPSVYVIPKITVELGTDDGDRAFAEFNKEAIIAGYEGIMVKDLDAPYETKRSAAWLKIKPFIEVSLEAIAIEKGKPGTKYENTLGAIVCRGEDDGRMIEVNVGSGISDEQRDAWFADPKQIIGMIVEIKADAMTQDRNTDEIWSLRFPRFKGFRGTTPGEKL